MKLIDTIGLTPLLQLKTNNGNVWGKAEFVNPGGSIKDRPVKHILQAWINEGRIAEGDTLCEATSGNMGISLAMLSANMGFKCKIVMPSNMSIERKQMLKYFGAELIEVEEGDFDAAIALRDQLCEENNWINFNQFHNPLNIDAHYCNTGPEIYKNLPYDIEPEAFILGTGTGGTLMGAGRFLKEVYPNIKIIAVEPLESPVMSGGKAGLHGIQGIGDGSKFLVDLAFVDEIITISTEESKTIAKQLAKQYGLFVGFSAAANYLASTMWLSKYDAKNVVTILCDRGERYFSCL
jgi:cysteine synthase A